MDYFFVEEILICGGFYKKIIDFLLKIRKMGRFIRIFFGETQHLGKLVLISKVGYDIMNVNYL